MKNAILKWFHSFKEKTAQIYLCEKGIAPQILNELLITTFFEKPQNFQKKAYI